MIFRDRADAGRRLARRLAPHADASPLVVGLPRGGVVVAAEVASALGAPLDLLVVRKIGAPRQPELGIGALAPDGVRVLGKGLAERVGATPKEVAEVEAREGKELLRRSALYRAGRPPLDPKDRTVILVDDGIATGFTVLAALRWLRPRMGRGRLVLAVPVIAASTARDIEKEVDELVALETPEDLSAIGAWYEDFGATTDEEVLRMLSPAATPPPVETTRRAVKVPLPRGRLEADLSVPRNPLGVVLFAHGSGSGRDSPRNRAVARTLEREGLATLLLDLLTPEEGEEDAETGRHRFDVRLLADRLLHAIDFLEADPTTAHLGIGLFGASTGAGAALVAAAERPGSIRAVVSRGGRPDLAGARALTHVKAPVLFLVGELDEEVLGLNRAAAAALTAEHATEVIPGATHLFEEPGALEEVATRAAGWFLRHRVTA